MKLKNVYLPHPQPNGGFRDFSLGGGLISPLCSDAMVVGFSEVRTLAGVAALSKVELLLFWPQSSAEKKEYTLNNSSV